MKSLYGFKASDVVGLIQMLKENEGEKLSNIFTMYAKKHNKARGTIRNLYYAIAKLSNEDEGFCKKYLNGHRLQVEKKQEFSCQNEYDLIRQILLKKSQGKSVRKAVIEMSEGEQKLALRYQNKYRTLLKTNPGLVEEIAKNIEKENPNIKPLFAKKEDFNEFQIKRVKKEIDSLLERTFFELKKENIMLRSKLEFYVEKYRENEKKEAGRISDFFRQANCKGKLK